MLIEFELGKLPLFVLDVFDFFCDFDHFLLCIKLFIALNNLKLNRGQKKNYHEGFYSLKLLQFTEFFFFVEYEQYIKTFVNLQELKQRRYVE